MSTTAVADRARRRARALMTSTCRVFANSEPTTDADGKVTRTSTVIWTGPCRVRPAVTGLTALAEDIGGGETFRFDYRVSIPFEVSTILEGMRVTILTSPDPALPGTTLEVQRVDRGDNLSARRLICQRMGG